MVVLSIESLGEERFIRGFTRIEAEFKDLSEAFDLLYEDFQEFEAEVFEREGDPEPFAPLSPAYAEWKERRYPGMPIMQLTQRLMKSLTKKTRDTVHKVSKNQATFGTTVPYANRHQRGGGGLPKRKVVQLTDARKVAWGRIVHRWALDKMHRRLD